MGEELEQVEVLNLEQILSSENPTEHLDRVNEIIAERANTLAENMVNKARYELEDLKNTCIIIKAKPDLFEWYHTKVQEHIADPNTKENEPIEVGYYLISHFLNK